MSRHSGPINKLDEKTMAFLLAVLVEDERNLMEAGAYLNKCSDIVTRLKDRVAKQREALKILGVPDEAIERFVAEGTFGAE